MRARTVLRVLAVSIVVIFALTVAGGRVFAQEKQIKIRYATQLPATHLLTQAEMRMAKMIEEKTKGRVKVEVYPAGQLFKGMELLKAVTSGACEMGTTPGAMFTGPIPLMDVFDIPFMITNYADVVKVWEGEPGDLLRKHLERIGIKTIAFSAYGENFSFCSHKPLTKPTDFKGLKIRCTGLSAKVAAAIGGAPVAMPVGDTYDALSRGVVDASFASMEAAEGWKWAEVTKYIIESGAIGYTTSFFVVMNKKVWNSFDPDTKKIIEKINEEWIVKEGNDWERIEKSGKEYAIKMGNKVTAFSKEEDEKVAKAVKPLLDDYVANMKKAGLPGDEALKFCLDELKKLQ